MGSGIGKGDWPNARWITSWPASLIDLICKSTVILDYLEKYKNFGKCTFSLNAMFEALA